MAESKRLIRTHTIHAQDGGLVEAKHYTRHRAIKAFCTECLGWEGNPAGDCTSPNCPLYPFRGRSMVAWRSHALRQAPESPGFLRKAEAAPVEGPERCEGAPLDRRHAESSSHPANPRIVV